MGEAFENEKCCWSFDREGWEALSSHVHSPFPMHLSRDLDLGKPMTCCDPLGWIGKSINACSVALAESSISSCLIHALFGNGDPES